MKKLFFKIRVTSGRNKGFSLIELSVVVSVAATALVGFLSWTQPKISTDSSLAAVTSSRMHEIQNAINSFRVQRKRLPCPADQLIRGDGSRVSGAITANFGTEAISKSAVPATCANPIGAVPVYSLGLDESYMNDGWGRRFTYQVADSICGTFACDAASYKNGTGNIKIVTSTATGSTITKNAAYVMVSHGANGSGAYLPSGQRIADGIGDELQNSTSYTTYGKLYVMANPSSRFDDIIVFSTKNSLESIVNKNSNYGISVADCEINSKALKNLTLTETNNMQSSLAGVTDLKTGDVVNADQGILGILKATQSVCVNYYGAGDSVTAKTIKGQVWHGGQCPGNNDPSANGVTYYAATDTCTCNSGLWDGSCKPQAPFINGLKLWLDAADSSTVYNSSDCATGNHATNNTNVGCWKDKSGYGNNATQPTLAQQPTYVTAVQNGNAALSFDGVADTLSLPDYIIADGNIPYTIFIIVKRNILGSPILQLLSGGDRQHLAFSFYALNNVFEYWGSDDLYSTNNSILVGVPYILTFKYDTSSGRTIYINNSVNAALGANLGRNGLNSGTGAVGKVDNSYLNGSIYEINVYNKTLTNEQVNSVYTYLHNKWGIGQ
jgi:hypothetical protein